jgi:hypothetical protein
MRQTAKDCHPERSTAASKANRRAQSKDPCSATILVAASRQAGN